MSRVGRMSEGSKRQSLIPQSKFSSSALKQIEEENVNTNVGVQKVEKPVKSKSLSFNEISKENVKLHAYVEMIEAELASVKQVSQQQKVDFEKMEYSQNEKISQLTLQLGSLEEDLQRERQEMAKRLNLIHRENEEALAKEASSNFKFVQSLEKQVADLTAKYASASNKLEKMGVDPETLREIEVSMLDKSANESKLAHYKQIVDERKNSHKAYHEELKSMIEKLALIKQKMNDNVKDNQDCE